MFGLVVLTTLEVHIYYVKVFGKLLFGAYNVATKVLLLNMLIAMMSKSFHSIVVRATPLLVSACLHLVSVEKRQVFFVKFDSLPLLGVNHFLVSCLPLSVGSLNDLDILYILSPNSPYCMSSTMFEHLIGI